MKLTNRRLSKRELMGTFIIFALAASACDSGGRTADLTSIPDPFPTLIESVEVSARLGADYDVNADTVVGACDLHELLTNYGDERAALDLDGNGSVGAEDALAWLTGNREFLGFADLDGDTDSTDGEIADLAQRFHGDELVVRFVPQAFEETAEGARYEGVLDRHGLQELRTLELGSDNSDKWLLVQTVDRDLDGHIKALAEEPLVAVIDLNALGQIVTCIEPSSHGNASD